MAWKKFVVDKDFNVEINDRDYCVLDTQKEFGNIVLGGVSAWPFLEKCKNVIIDDNGCFTGAPKLTLMGNMYIALDALVNLDFDKIKHGNIIVEPYHKDFVNKNFFNTTKMEFNEYGRYKSWLIPPNYYRWLSVSEEVKGIRDLFNQILSEELHKKRTPLLYNEVFSANFEEDYAKVYKENLKKQIQSKNSKIQDLNKQICLIENDICNLTDGLNNLFAPVLLKNKTKLVGKKETQVEEDREK